MSSEGNSSDVTYKIPALPQEILKGPATRPVVSKEPILPTPKSSTIEYSAPSWSCPVPQDFHYTIETIKNGQIVETIDLKKFSTSSFISIGRFPPCDIVMDHPSISRHHCILQYGTLNEGMGWYLYDLDSTHGTKLNKKVVPKRFYVRLRTGSVFQIAGSTRLFSLCGPDSEDELKKAVEMTKQKQNENNDEEMKDEPEISKYYAKDPLKWLDDYLEREGLPMNFQFVKAEDAKDWTCSIELADDIPGGGGLISATAPSRREAQFQCALLACERLDSAGVLRDHLIRNKKRTLAENDYYEEDEDTFYDRTGQLEEQRKKRRMRIESDASGEQQQVAHTYDELKESLLKAEKQLAFIQGELRKLLEKNSCVVDGQEVANTSLSFSTRMAISQMKTKQKNMEADCTRLQKLIKIAQPRSLTEMLPEKKHPLPNQSELKTEQEKEIVIPEVKIEVEEKPTLLPPIKESSLKEANEIECLGQNQNRVTAKDVIKPETPESIEEILGPELPGKEITTKPSKKTKTFDPVLPSKSKFTGFGLVTREELKSLKQPTAKKRNVMVEEDEIESVQDTHLKSNSYNDQEMDPDTYATWVPPEGQTGDGKTKLNEKFAGRY